MKTMKSLAILGAIALTGTLTACSSASDEVIDNPNYDEATNTVKTQLAISLPQQLAEGEAAMSPGITRQTQAIVQGQATPLFRGMTGIRLIPYANFVPSTNPAVRPMQDKLFDLADISAFDNASKQNAKIYNDLAIPIGTGAFMLYGKAIDDPDYTLPEGEKDMNVMARFHNGVVNAPATFIDEASEYKFSLLPIYAGGINERATTLVGYVKAIHNLKDNAGITNHTLHNYLNAFQPSAGSSASILAAVQELWDKVRSLNLSATELALVRTYIINNETSTIFVKIDENNKIDWVYEKCMNYPHNIYLPDGAACIDWTNPSEPVVVTAGKSGEVPIAALTNYVYPAALCYRANTDIAVSNTDRVSETFGEDTWADIVTSKYETGKVTPNTRSIALINQINYAVGRLDVTIQCADNVLYDSKGNAVNVPAAGFPVSAVIVGNQKNVNYQFVPIETEPAYSIYDCDINGNMAATVGGPTGINHTLVMETNSELKQVRVVVELTNTSGTAFYGKDGLVPVNGKFYLAGVLDITNNTEHGEIKPDASNPRIFVQDYTTTANFTIRKGTLAGGNVGLGSAYNVIPDLQTPSLEVAFSVNINWREGIKFDKNL